MFLPGHENPEAIRDIVERQSKWKGFEFLQKISKQQPQKFKNHHTARVITQNRRYRYNLLLYTLCILYLKNQVYQSSLLSYVRHSCPVARARGSCLKRKTIKLSMRKTIWNILKVRITYTVRKQMEIKLNCIQKLQWQLGPILLKSKAFRLQVKSPNLLDVLIYAGSLFHYVQAVYSFRQFNPFFKKRLPHTSTI